MEKLFNAHAGAITRYDQAEFDIELGFNVVLKKHLQLNLGLPKLLDSDQLVSAKRCMVVLLGGGKRVILEVDSRETFAYVYCFRKVNPSFTISIGTAVVADIAKIMQSMFTHEFDSEYMVKEILTAK